MAFHPMASLTGASSVLALVRTMTAPAAGNAVLQNPAFDGANGNQPYFLQIDISCMKVIGNIAFFGGTTRRRLIRTS
jgi:hypothetical protein